MAPLHWLCLAVLAAGTPGASGQNTLFSKCEVRTLAGGPGLPPFSGPPNGSADGDSTSAQFWTPLDTVFDPVSGSVYVADFMNQRVRVIDPLSRSVSTVNYDFSQSVGPSDGPSALVVAPGRTIYVSTNRSIFLIVASQTPPLVVVLPTLLNVFTYIGGMALDAATLTLYVSDKMAQAIYAVDLNTPQPQPFLIAGVPNKPEPNGQRNAFDGSLVPGSIAARFAGPTGLAFDLFNRILFVADFDANAIRTVAVTPPFAVTTIAGDITLSIQGRPPSSVSGRNYDGIGTAANFSGPVGVAMAGPGQVVVTDYYNSVLRFVSLVGPTLTLTGVVGANAYDDNEGYQDGVGSNAKFNGIYGITPVWGNPRGGNTFAPPPNNAFTAWVLADALNNNIRVVNCTAFPPPATPTPSPRPTVPPVFPSTAPPPNPPNPASGAATGPSSLPPLTLGLYIGVPLLAALLGAVTWAVLYYTLCSRGGGKSAAGAGSAGSAFSAAGSTFTASSGGGVGDLGGERALANPLANASAVIPGPPSSPPPSYSDLPGTPTGPSTSASSIQDWQRS